MKNSVHGVLHKCGILIDDASDVFSIKGRARLEELDLDDASRKELSRKLQVIDDLDVHVAMLARDIKRNLVQDERARLLMAIPGVGVLTAYAILAEIGTIDRFPTSRALAAYAGLLSCRVHKSLSLRPLRPRLRRASSVLHPPAASPVVVVMPCQ